MLAYRPLRSTARVVVIWMIWRGWSGSGSWSVQQVKSVKGAGYVQAGGQAGIQGQKRERLGEDELSVQAVSAV